MRVPWTTRRSYQSILKEINTDYSLEGLILRLKLQSFGHLKQRIDSLEKILMLGKIEGSRRVGQRMRWWNGITDSTDMNLGTLQEMVRDREAWHAVVHGVAELDMTGRLNNNNNQRSRYTGESRLGGSSPLFFVFKYFITDFDCNCCCCCCVASVVSDSV